MSTSETNRSTVLAAVATRPAPAERRVPPAGPSPPAAPPAKRQRPSAAVIVAALAAVAALIYVAANLRRGLTSEEIMRPGVSGHPRGGHPYLGWDHWVAFWEIGGSLAFLTMAGIFLRRSRAIGRIHPVLLIMGAFMVMVVWDPLQNWATYAAYDPRLLHFPESWAWANISPTTEPVILIPLYAVYFFLPSAMAAAVLRRVHVRRPDSWVRRRPLLAIALLTVAIGFVFDGFCEVLFFTKMQLYTMTHVAPFGSVYQGQEHQFPLIFNSGLITLPMAAAGVLLWRDDTGRTQAEKLAMRWRLTARRPRLGEFAVMVVAVNIAYAPFFLGFAALRQTDSARIVAQPWRYQETKVYDPQGHYRDAGVPGPYFRGVWDGWLSGR
jgi:hypothetical protein